jgi:hypothetical protein
MDKQGKRGADAMATPGSDLEVRAAALTEVAAILGMAARQLLESTDETPGADTAGAQHRQPTGESEVSGVRRSSRKRRLP